MDEEEEGVFGQRTIRRGEGDDRLGWEGWSILFGLALAAVPATLSFPVGGLRQLSFGSPVFSPPAPSFDSTRLTVGLGMALLLLAAATWLIVRTNWVDGD